MRIDGPTRVLFSSLVLALTLVGCEPGGEPPPQVDMPDEEVTPLTEAELAEAQELAGSLAETARSPLAEMSFEDFKATVYKEDFEGGKYIVNGDTTIVDDKHLEEFFDALKMLAAPAAPTAPGEIAPEPQASLVVHQEGGVDAVWDSVQKGTLTYCVSDNFGADKSEVVAQMAAATGVWEAVAAVDFTYDSTQDADCNAFNSNVVFDVRRVNVNGQYLARAFFPGEPRISSNVLIDESSFELDPSPPAKLNLKGILAHELGHTLGFRHEHTRPDSGTCFEDANWRKLSDYDPFSVMHYPQCNGLGDWSLTLTHKDKNGAACLYGAAEGFEIDTGVCQPEVEDDVEPGTEQVVTMAGESVASQDRDEFGPFAVAPGTVFSATISGTGDPDLYVRFDLQATRTSYDCRPFLWGAEESCSLDVPAGESEAFVMVFGFSEGTYDLEVRHTPAADG